MKVKHDTDPRRVARWLNFLKQATDITVAQLAGDHGLRRSNLTMFINSGGRPGALSLEKACRALLGLGVLPDGTLRPGLHRWSVPSIEMASVLVDLLHRNTVSWGAALVLGQGGGYLMLQIGRLVSVFAELSENAMDGVRTDAELVKALAWIQMDPDGDAATKMLWQTEDDRRVLDHFSALHPAAPTSASATARM